MGVSADLALPDVGLTTLSEVAARTTQIARMTDLPVLVDADTGFGEPLSAARTVVRGRRDPDFVVWMQTRGQLYEVLDYDAYAAFDDSVAGFRADTPQAGLTGRTA